MKKIYASLVKDGFQTRVASSFTFNSSRPAYRFGALLALTLLAFSPTAFSQQVFTPMNGASNPLNGVDVGDFATPIFADIDGDGDRDVLIGRQDGTFAYYRNTGTASVPVFTLQTGAASPFSTLDVSDYSAPSLVDIDGDGDLDLFSGEIFGSVHFFRNTGTASAPVYTEVTGAANPFNGISAGNFSKPALVDIDHDGDFDAFVGHIDGTTSFYRNTGTATAPVFVAQTGASNPLNNGGVSGFAYPAFFDIEGDGDLDVAIGANNGTVQFFKNTGTASAPVYVQQGGAANPFGSINVPYASPAFVDLKNDGLIDVVIGGQDGSVAYYENTSILPMRLLAFNGVARSGYYELTWQTAQETNAKSFDVEVSSDGVNFTKLATVSAAGNGNNNYSVKDASAHSGKTFYRLKMNAVDAKFTYSSIIWVNVQLGGKHSIYPNPAVDVININIGDAKVLKTTAGIYDAIGRLRQNFVISNYQQQVNVQSLSKGIYVIKFADGSSHSFKKD